MANGNNDFVCLVPPKIYEYRNVTETEGGTATLKCLSEGNPSPDMTFRKIGNDYDYVVGANVSQSRRIKRESTSL